MTPGPEYTFGGDFFSPASGPPLSLDAMFLKVVDYVREDGACRYNLIIGTDSFLNTSTLFVTAVIIHRVGRGGRYFYMKRRRKKITNLRQRMFYEATMSVELASIIKAKLDDNGLEELPLEIHLDVGDNGSTRDMVKEVVGMVTGSGYPAVTKPDSYGASKVADRHSK